MSSHLLITMVLVASFIPIIGAIKCIDYWESHIAHVGYPHGNNDTWTGCKNPATHSCFATKCLYRNNPNQWVSIKGCIDQNDPAYCVDFVHKLLFERLRDNGELGKLNLAQFRCAECNFAGDQEHLEDPDIMPLVTSVKPVPSFLTGTSVEPEPSSLTGTAGQNQHTPPSPSPMSKSPAYNPKATLMMMVMIGGLLAMAMGLLIYAMVEIRDFQQQKLEIWKKVAARFLQKYF